MSKREPVLSWPARNGQGFNARASLALLSRSAVRARGRGLGLFAAFAILAHLLLVGVLLAVPAMAPFLRPTRHAEPQPPGQATIEMVIQKTPSVGGSVAKPSAAASVETARQGAPAHLSSRDAAETAPPPGSGQSQAAQARVETKAQAATPSQPAPEVNIDATGGLGYGLATGPNVVPASPDSGHVNQPPSYPVSAQERGEQGAVGLLITVAPDGSAASVEIASSSGYPVLDAEAKRAVSRWHFRPEVRDGHPVQSLFNEQIEFEGRVRD
jgi:protein TonB